jgi:hypothetical protein
MFISSLLQGDKPPGENWRWVNSPETWDPLHECRPHFRTLESIALFEPEQRGGLGIEPAPKLLDARIRVAGQLYTWGMMHEGSRLMSFEEARRLYPWLAAGARAEWDRTVASVEERLGEGAIPEREAYRAWDQRGLAVAGSGSVELSDIASGTTRTDATRSRMLPHEGLMRESFWFSTPRHRYGRCFVLGDLALVRAEIGLPQNCSSILSAFGGGWRPWYLSGRRRMWASRSTSGST